jgi:hypothetical protein
MDLLWRLGYLLSLGRDVEKFAYDSMSMLYAHFSIAVDRDSPFDHTV